eukprot:scaffold553535_cov42-Prasinocladus_malaysianus.AAC.1
MSPGGYVTRLHRPEAIAVHEVSGQKSGQAAASSARPPSSSGSEEPTPAFVQMSQFCRKCGGQMDLFEESKDTWRHMCADCGYIDYFNPKM